MALFFVAGRLYVNSLLVALNVRGTMRKLWRGVGSGSGPGGGQRRSYTVHLDSRNSAPGVSPTDAIALKAFAIRGPPPPRVDVHVDIDVERGMSAESEEAPVVVTAVGAPCSAWRAQTTDDTLNADVRQRVNGSSTT
jgi:hypothetical protein